MIGEIRHNGIIKKLDGPSVWVKIIQESACDSCRAKTLCRVSEYKEKEIEVTNCTLSNLHENQPVIVCGSLSSGFRAVIFAFAIPLVLLLLSLITTIIISGDEALAAVVSIISLLPYYMVLYIFRNRMKKKFQFRIIG